MEGVTKMKSNKTDHPTYFQPEVEEVLASLNLKTDSLDSPSFDVVAYINEMFPTEQSLANIDDVIADTERKLDELESETRGIIHSQWQIEEEGQEVVQEAMQMMKTLFTRIHDVQDRATRSEQMVHDITKDIQQLDQAKRNLTVSITTLNNLILIVNALDRLNELLQIKRVIETAPRTPEKIPKVAANPFADSENTLESEKNPRDSKQATKFCLSFVSEVSDLLSQAQRLMQPMLAAYQSISSISSLANELDTIHSVLAGRLARELRALLAGSRNVLDNAALIQMSCQLVELMPEKLSVKSNLLAWFISRQLGEYRELFDPSQTAAWIDKIDHRYAWLRSNLPPMERKFQAIFPSHWHVTEELIAEFCRITRMDLEIVMKRRQAELTHNLLIFGLQRTLAFESSLNKIYPDYTPSECCQQRAGAESSNVKRQKSLNPFDDDEEVVATTPISEKESDKQGLSTMTDDEANDADWKKQAFDGLISSCFDAHFDLYLNHVERALHDQLHNRLIGDFTVNKSSLSSHELTDVLKSSDQVTTAMPVTTGDSGENTLYSATDLFLLYKQIIKQTLQLNRGQGLLGLVRLLRQYLSEYTLWVLLAQIPGISIGMPAAATSGASEMTAKMAAFGLSGLSALGIGRGQTTTNTQTDGVRPIGRASLMNGDQSNVSLSQLFSSLLRDDQQLPRLSKDDIHKVSIILVTAAFCLKTVEELEARLRVEIRPPSWASKISFSQEMDGFAACRSVCVHRLVSDLESAAEPQLAAMARLPWNNLTQVGDQSVYVTEIIKHLRTQVPLIRDTLYSVRATFTQICIKFAGSLITRFIGSLYRCKPLNTFGAEQLLLDTQSLKSALLQMPVLGSKFTQQPPRSFTNLVHEGMGGAERIIKAVMLPVGSTGLPQAATDTSSTPSGFVMGPVDASAAEAFLASYRQLLPDATPTDLQKVLEMKGIKAAEQQLILDAFRIQYDANKSSVPAVIGEKETKVSATDETTRDRSKLSMSTAPKSSTNQPAATDSSTALQAGRIRQLEKLVKKRR
ncbi:Vacuolar protein sorting-associated protein 53 [Clonorchis sinensis]|uniref:Vacuolar protein sorting-associated protein 53 homolog n=1 Tax=Clonorchis sinensis TaxID=79923 RepID=A0A8T1M538_CLOSI|nr:Vacuolar protein sorting-associated protein 53 [Clonorchis sinensis]